MLRSFLSMMPSTNWMCNASLLMALLNWGSFGLQNTSEVPCQNLRCSPDPDPLGRLEQLPRFETWDGQVAAWSSGGWDRFPTLLLASLTCSLISSSTDAYLYQFFWACHRDEASWNKCNAQHSKIYMIFPQPDVWIWSTLMPRWCFPAVMTRQMLGENSIGFIHWFHFRPQRNPGNTAQTSFKLQNHIWWSQVFLNPCSGRTKRYLSYAIVASCPSGSAWKIPTKLIWVCLKIVYPYTQWLMIIIPIKWL